MSTIDSGLSTSDKLIEIQERHGNYHPYKPAGNNVVLKQLLLERNLMNQDRGYLLEHIKELEAEKTCTWKRQKLGTDWDEYDSWGTSCGEDFAIVEEWHDTPTKFCGNCGGKTQQAIGEDECDHHYVATVFDPVPQCEHCGRRRR